MGNSDRDVVHPRTVGVKSVLVDRKEYLVKETPDYKHTNKSMSYTPKVEKAAITYEKNVTIDDVVSEADHIFAEFKRRRFRPDDHKALDDFHLEMFETHQDWILNRRYI